jgi:carboxyl-terminal processing protease
MNTARLVKRLFGLMGLMAVVLMGFAGINAAISGQESDFSFKINKNIDLFSKILKEVSTNYVEEVDPNQLAKVGIDAMLALIDPYTNFYTASNVEDARIEQSEQLSGIGETLLERQGQIVISAVGDSMPAQKAGLKPGDVILKIDGEVIQGRSFSTTDVTNLLKGQSGSRVDVTIRRFGQDQPKVITVQREDTKAQNVPFSGYVAPGIGYVNHTVFTANSGANIRKAIDDLLRKDKDLKGLILDLRDNPGGLLHEAVNICNLFNPKGQLIVEMRGKSAANTKRFDTQVEPVLPQIPVTILINEGSASASEIVSGAMQDLDRGVVIGQKSFGKGLVQNVNPLSFNAQMKVTIAKYYTPSGRCIQAIDYSKRDAQGKAIKTSDSLARSFKTRNGRTVVDATGVNPDIPVAKKEFHKVTKDLIAQHIIFDFATQYFYQHPTIADVESFEVDDQLYNEFVQYVQQRNFQSESRFKTSIEALAKSLEKEAYYKDLKGEFEQLQQQIDEKRKQDIYTHKAEIKRLLRLEIVFRYYNQSGKIRSAFKDDEEVLAAIQLLGDIPRYQQILSGK